MNLQQIGTKIGMLQEKNPYLFIIGFVLAFVVALPGLFLLLDNVEPSLEKVLPQDLEEIILLNNMRSEFSADMVHIVFFIEEPLFDVLDPQVFQYLDMFTQRVVENDFVFSTQSIANLLQGPLPQSIESSMQLLTHPHIYSLINYDRSLTVMHVQTDTGATASSIASVVSDIEMELERLENSNPGLRYYITGFTVIDKATFTVIISDFMKITGLSFFLIVAFLLLYFRSFIKVGISLSLLGFSVLLTLGFVGYIGIEITVVTMVAAAMIMALGISYAVNILYEYETIAKSVKSKLPQLQQKLIVALIGSSLTTSSGFLALLFGVIPAMKNLGIILAMGILITMITGILLIPVLLHIVYGGKKK